MSNLYLKQNIMEKEKKVFGKSWGRTCQRCWAEMKRIAKYCIKCRKIVDDELWMKARAKKKAS